MSKEDEGSSLARKTLWVVTRMLSGILLGRMKRGERWVKFNFYQAENGWIEVER